MTIPYIPDNAPFTAEQRAWLNGLLASMFANAPHAPAEAKPSRRIAVLYASQSGTAEGLARKLAKELKAQGHIPAVATLSGYTPAALAAESCALILASTYGDGDAPDEVQPFYEALCLEHFPRMEKLSYAIFALGDSHYEHFCKFGKDLDAKLIALGANQLVERVDCDVDIEEPFAQWKALMKERLHENPLAPPVKTKAPANETDGAKPAEPGIGLEAAARKAFTRDHPLLAPMIDKRSLTHLDSTKSTLHLAFSIEGAGLQYEAGDACGVLPTNDLNLVAEILQKLHCNGNERTPSVKAGTTTLHDALTRERQVTRLNRKIVQSYATRGNCTPLLDLLQPERQASLDAYIFDRGLIDLLSEYPDVFDDPAELVALLPKLTPRLYSISSSPI
ncbi:MAG TPA: flavodoxin domain-containing protein, partial [Acidobacteriaceae bacterium]|nr:flavodoxin domain-containing protein [Acidobacteriaceae bacterium]